MKPNESVGDWGSTVTWTSTEPTVERRAWELLLAMSYALTSEEDDGKREAIGRAFDLAEMFAAEAAKRRTGGV